MKILIFSDSHGDVDTMSNVVKKEKPDTIIHLGDSIKDAEQLNIIYPDIEIIKILGGIDITGENEEWTKYIEISGKRFMLTHGHTILNDVTSFGQGEQRMWMAGGNVDIVLYGHTHEPFIYCCEGKWIMNPGCICRIPKNLPGHNIINATYGILIINKNGGIQFNSVEVGPKIRIK
jgi:putative phosphoesterase